MVYNVVATSPVTGRYRHYICRHRENAERLAAFLRAKSPQLEPITVEEDERNPEPGRLYADDPTRKD